ncbi:MAG: CHAT domain-containing tetratricopeptide repeat protein [Bacteroidia bacterium]
MKKYILLIVIIVLFRHVNAQNKTIDSLNSVLLNAKHDTTRAKIYLELAEKGHLFNNDTIIPLCLKTLLILDKIPEKSMNRSLRRTKAGALNTIGFAYVKKGNMFKAQEYYNLSLNKFQEIKDNRGIATILISLGGIYSVQGEKLKALEFDEKSLKIFEEIKDRNGIGGCLNNIGAIYKDMGDYDKSLSYYRRSLQIRQEIEDEEGIANTFNNIGTIYQNIGNNDTAIKYLMKGLKLREKIGDLSGIANSLSCIGNVYDHQGDTKRALDFYKKGLKMRKEIGSKLGIAYTMINIGGVYKDQGDNIQALECYKECLNLFEQIGYKKGIAGSLNNIGSIYKITGNSAEALEYFLKSIKIQEDILDKKGLSFSFNNIGMIYYSLDSLENALHYFKKSYSISEEIRNKQGLGISLCNLSAVYLKQKKYDESKVACENSLEIALQLGYPKEIKEASKQLFLVLIRTKQWDSAYIQLIRLTNQLKISLKNNFPSLSEKEKELYFATLEKDYMLYNDFSNFYHNQIPQLTDTAYNISLSNKGLTLKSSSAMRNSILSSDDTTLIKEYLEWNSLKKKIAKFYESGKDIKESENKANEIEKDLVKKSNSFRDLDKIKNLDWKQVQRSLKKTEAAIEFVHFKSEIDTANPTEYAALIIKPESSHPVMINLFNEKQLIKILGAKTETSADYITSIYGKKNKSNTQLYDLIWKPMEEILKGVKTIYYSPSGILHKISFAALCKGNDIYLCDNHRLELQGSTGKLAIPEKFEFGTESTFGIYGDINYDTPETLKDTTALLTWPYLEGTKTEAEKVANILKTNNLKHYYIAGKNATESEFKIKSQQSNIIHIATHGFFFPEPDAYTYTEKQDSTNKKTQIYRRGESAVGIYNFIINKNPLMRSGLVFAGANEVWSRKEYIDKEDGVLTAQEVATLDLRKTNLVVLSACETGLGDVKGTEGVYGLQRSFKMAGVKFIIMSLWQVPDAETVEFMDKFYTKLTKTKDIKNSFYETSNEMRKKYDPFYWGAFVLLE